MNDTLLKINEILTRYYAGLLSSVECNNGIVGEYFDESSDLSPRLLCQTRSIFFLVKFYEIFNDKESLELAHNIYINTRKVYKKSEGWCMQARENEPLDLYGFASLSYAEILLFQSTGSNEIAKYSEETLGYLTNIILNDDFEVESSLYQNKVSQNPLMHLFESFVFAYEVFQKDAYKDAAIKILNIVYRNFYNTEFGAIMEVLFVKDMPYWYEPGHLFEWGSLLKVAEEQEIVQKEIDYISLVNLAEKITEEHDYIVPAKVHIPNNKIEKQYRIWASLERARVHFLLGNSQLANVGIDQVLNSFFDSNNLPYEFLNSTDKNIKSTTGYHIINCLQEAIKWIRKNA